MSKPLQVYLDEADVARLEAWSRERGWSKSQAVRVAIRALTRPRPKDPLLALSGSVIDDLPDDCSEQFDHYLLETFVAESPPRYRGGRRSQARLRR